MLTQYQDDLIASARAIVSTSFWSGPVAALRVPKIEPELAASLIEFCSIPLTRAWGRVLNDASLDLTLHAAFLHQRPYVRFPSPTTADCGSGYCELADMLIVVEHDGHARRACLFQAKPAGVAVVGAQKDLYEKWEALRFASGSKNAKGRVYDIGPNTEGGNYAIVHTEPKLGVEPWGVEHPRKATTPDDLGRYLALMLVANVDGAVSGPGRPATVSGSDDWSILISDLLSSSAGKNYRSKHFWQEGAPRSASRPISFAMEWDIDGVGHLFASTVVAPPGEPPFGDLPADDEGTPPLNMLYLRTTSRAEAPRDD